MRRVIDLQACQSSGSRTRGIGRYSLALAQAMVRRAGEHEIWLLLSGLFPDTIEPLREAFAGMLPADHIRVWHTPGPVATHDGHNTWRRRAGEIVREQVLAELRPDIIHVTSLFEGYTDDAVTNVGALPEHLPTAVTLYDLIPLVHASHYLAWPPTRDWYYRKLNALKNADLLLAISDATRTESLAWLHLTDERVVNISSAVDERFRPQLHDAKALGEMRATYGIVRPFVMYTGGIDHRKNIEGLIRAFAALPLELRRQYQLAVVCSAQPEDRERLLKLARRAGLDADELLMTGFVPDEVLPMLYNDCSLFVFPSWHEGFGLPALEAMSCGAPVIAANTSSLPVVVGRADALFDPRDESAITASMQRALTDAEYRTSLRAHGIEQAKNFSWDASAERAIAAFEDYHARRHAAAQSPASVPQRKPSMAFLSPLPPDRSGIADYSAELLPELARYYDITIIVCGTEVNDPCLAANFPTHDWRWFDAHAGRFERVLYHFGNSEFHSHMFPLLARHPGVVVLHDFFLSGILAHLDAQGDLPGGWARALYASHGYHALLARQSARESRDTVMQFPCNGAVLDGADGVIVHAQYSLQLAQRWYGRAAAEAWALVPLLRRSPVDPDRKALRDKLGLRDDDFLVCSFGMLGPTKLNDRLLDAWLASPLGADPRCRLVFVGANDNGPYGQSLTRKIKASRAGKRISITGFADPDLFRAYLGASDVAVQLRTLSRGETSAAVLDCMAHGLPTIINAHAAMAELPEHALIKLSDEFTDSALAQQLMALRTDPPARRALGQKAVEYLRAQHAPASVAARYVEAIERFARCEPRARRRRTIAAIAAIEAPASEADLHGVAAGLAASHAVVTCRQILVDLTIQAGGGGLPDARLAALIATPPPHCRIEPVMLVDGLLRYARTFTCALLGLEPLDAGDDVIETRPGDYYIGPHRWAELQMMGVTCMGSLAEVEPERDDKRAYASV